MLLPLLNKLGLFFTNPLLIVPVAVGGLLTKERRIYSQALLLVTFTTIYNAYLKSIWQVPLPAPLKGWAFPSGHMHSAVIFWGYLAYEYRNPWVSLAVSAMLALSGFGLVYSGYHYMMDVAGALGFGALTLSLHALLNKNPAFQEKPSREGFLLSILGTMLTAIMPPIARRVHVWQALGVVMAYTLGWTLYEQYQRYKATSITKQQPNTAPDPTIALPSASPLPSQEKAAIPQSTSNNLLNTYHLRRRRPRDEQPTKPLTPLKKAPPAGKRISTVNRRLDFSHF